MVIGVFFSEVGTKLLGLCSGFSSNLDRIRQEAVVTRDWSEQDFGSARRYLQNAAVDVQKGKRAELRDFLLGSRHLMVSLLLNPALMEHESFTDLLHAVFHLPEELAYRRDVTQSSHADNEHLTGDIVRVYSLLIDKWLDYMKYLQDNYPYLFSLASRTNPFDTQASPVVK